MGIKAYADGLILGAILAALIVWENVVMPNYGSDSAPLMLISVALVGLYINWAAYRATRRGGEARPAVMVGAVTSLVGFSLSMLTFFVIDNLFLGTVSRQADKIWGYQHSSYSSMQAYINAGLVRGLLMGIPASVAFGAVCGWLATVVARHTKHEV